MTDFKIKIGTHKKDGFVVRFTDDNHGQIVASSIRFGDKSTGTVGEFNIKDFKIIWTDNSQVK